MNRLKIIREKKSLTLAQLSARTSIPVRLLGDYEANLLEIPPPHMKALAKALWVKPDELVAVGPAPAPGGVAPPPGPLADRGPAPAPSPVAIAAPPSAPPAPAGMPPSEPAPYARPAPPPMPNGAPPDMAAPPRPAYAPAPPPRRPMGPPAGDMGRPPGRPAMGGGRGKRDPVAMPATEGQMTEIMRLAARLNLSTAQLETQFSRPLADITRFDAREWIKQLREEAATKAPPSKIHFGQWPGLKDDLEAVYLNEQKTTGAPFRFVLFNGEALEGPISDFTPYTITIAETETGNQLVLRKLAVAYYRRLGEGDGPVNAGEESTNGHEALDNAPFPGPAQPQFAPPTEEPTEEPTAQAGGGA